MLTIAELKKRILDIEKNSISDYIPDIDTYVYELSYIGNRNINLMANYGAKSLKKTMKDRKMSNVNICKVVFGSMRTIPIDDTIVKMTYMRIDFKGE